MFRNKRTILLGLILALALFVAPANADYIFGTPTNLGLPVNSFDHDWNPSIRADGLEMYFESDRPDGEGTYDIWVSTRASKEDDWGAPTNLGAPINTPDWQNSPCISADGLELYFNDWGLWVVRRATVSDPWGEKENDSLINVNTSNVSSGPCLSSDGLSLFLFSWAEQDLYVSTRPTRDDLWSEPVNLGPTVNGVNSTWENSHPTISADGLVLVFKSDRDGGSGGTDLWMTRRSTIDGPWSEPVNLGPTVNGDRWDTHPEISADGKSLLFCSNRREGRYGGYDIWQVSIDPVVDLNSDGIVDALDMCIIVDYWGTDEPLCDIGPTPFGDGVVDVQDLIVLAEHISRSSATEDFIIVDDFEAYNEIWPGEEGTNLIFMTWADGYEVPENGSTMGSLEALVETSIVHEGSQSAPLHYDNTIVAYSEVTAYVANQQPAWPPNSLPIGRYWTGEGVGVLSLWFHGKADNDAEPMYVALNGIAVYHDNANATQVAEWEEWTIPLQEFADLGVDLTNVNSITIGFGTQGDTTTAGGSGMVLFDDIRIYTGQ